MKIEIVIIVIIVFLIFFLLELFKQHMEQLKKLYIVAAILALITTFSIFIPLVLEKVISSDNEQQTHSQVSSEKKKTEDNEEKNDNKEKVGKKQKNEQKTDKDNINTDDADISLFVNCYEDHEPKGVATQIGFNKWDDEKVDIQGINHEGDLYLFIGDLFNMMQPTGDSKITSILHFIVNPKYDLSDKITISGYFVVDSKTMGSNAYAKATIKVDGKEKWTSKKKITGNTIKPIPFTFDIKNGNLEMTMIFKCNALDSGLGIGIIFDDIN